jgi:hypothetical protein
MRLFVERFAIPVLVAGLIGIVTNTLKLPDRIRIPVIVVLGVAAATAALSLERRRGADKVESDHRRSNALTLLAVAVASGAIALLVHFRNPGDNAATIPHEGNASQPPGETIPGPGPVAPKPDLDHGSAENLLRKSPPKSRVLDYISATPWRRGSGPAWAVLMYSEDGHEYPILRATAQQALASNSISTPALFKNSTPPEAYEDVFSADVSTMSELKPYCDGLVLGRLKLNTGPSDQFNGMYTTHLGVDVKLV